MLCCKDPFQKTLSSKKLQKQKKLQKTLKNTQRSSRLMLCCKGPFKKMRTNLSVIIWTLNLTNHNPVTEYSLVWLIYQEI